MTRKPARQITKREIAAIHAFYAPAYGKQAPEVPKERAPSRDLEHKEQVKVIVWWSKNHERFGLPIFALFSIPNGGARGIETAQRMKDEGVRRGIPDLMLAVPRYQAAIDVVYRGAFIEMKATDGRESKEQVEVREFLTGRGYLSAVCYGAEEAIDCIKTYLRG